MTLSRRPREEKGNISFITTGQEEINMIYNNNKHNNECNEQQQQDVRDELHSDSSSTITNISEDGDWAYLNDLIVNIDDGDEEPMSPSHGSNQKNFNNMLTKWQKKKRIGPFKPTKKDKKKGPPTPPTRFSPRHDNTKDHNSKTNNSNSSSAKRSLEFN